MKNLFIILFFSLCNSIVVNANSDIPYNTENIYQIYFRCKKINETSTNQGPHRTPPSYPQLYYREETSTLVFGDTLTGATIIIIETTSGNTVFSTTINSNMTEIEIPVSSNNKYEIHVHLGDFCFFGELI